jgi:prophage maintenance system killer protein
MLVTERIPLAEIIELAAELTTDALLVEFVPPDDPMFRTLARGRDQLFEYLTNDFFESACRKRFDIARSHQLADSRRTLYLLRKKESAR